MFTVTVERPTGTDADGNPKVPDTHTEDGCWTAPGGSSEDLHLESTVTWDLDLYAPYEADIRSGDVVLVPGDPERYQVDGRPERWQSPSDGWAPGMVVRLKAVS